MRGQRLFASTLVLFGASVVLATRSAEALDGPRPGAVSANTLALPDKPGSVRGLSDAASLAVFSGQVSYAVPLELPQAAAGFAPALALTYAGELGNGPLGVGWTMPTGAIRRSLRHGVPHYDDTDELELVGIGMGGRLVPAPEAGLPFPRWYVEGRGKTVKVERKGPRFEVTAPDGTRFFFGSSAASREHDPQNDARVQAWLADQMISTAGQNVELTYVKDRGQVYLHELRWGLEGLGDGGAALRLAAPKYLLKLVYTDRFDPVISLRAGYEVVTARRLQRVEVESFGAQVRSYELTYGDQEQDAAARMSFPLSRLSRIEQRGLAGAGRLPVLRFSYHTPTFAGAVLVPGVDGWVLNGRGVSLGDVDGDGLPDLLRLEAGNHQYKKNFGGHFGPARPLSGAGDVDLESSRLVDLDGDARAELVRVVDDTWRRYTIEDAKAWQARGEWRGTLGVGLAGRDSVFCDLDGDGRTDVVTGSADAVFARFGADTGLEPPRRLPRISAADARVEPGEEHVRFADVNGDGLADVVWFADEWMRVSLGRGDGTFAPFARALYPWGVSPFDLSDLHLVDLDRDGLVDLVRFTAGHVSFYRGEASLRFADVPRRLERPEGAAYDAVVTFGDVLGTGSQQVVWSSPRGLWALDVAGVGSQGMLSGIDNGFGKTTTFRYSTSGLLAAAAEREGKPWLHKLPVNVPVPNVVVIDPGFGGKTRTTIWGVRDGLWDGVERRLGGFLEGTQVTEGATPVETLIETTRFHAGLGPDRVLRGTPWLVRKENGLGQAFSERREQWRAQVIDGLEGDEPQLRRPVLTDTRTSFLEGVATPIETRSAFEHDGEARVIAEHHLGRVGVRGDEREVRRRFASDPRTGVRDVVCREETFEGDETGATGALVERSDNVYGDNLGEAVAAPGEPCGVGKGWLRREVGWLVDRDTGAERSITLRSRAYDTLGNATAVYEDGVQREIGYSAAEQDPVYGIPHGFFPTSETVRPDATRTLTWKSRWDPRHGLTTVLTAPTGVTTRITLDSLGRRTATAIDSAHAHVRDVFEWEARPPRTTTFTWDGPAANAPASPDLGDRWRRSITFYDGLGDDLYTATALGGDRWIISDWVETDQRGLPAVAADSFYLTAASPTLLARPAVADFRAQTLIHDALGRLVEHRLPNGGFRRVAYRALEQTTTSSDMAPARSVFDGFMRPVRTERRINNVLEEVDATYDAGGQLTSLRLQGSKAEHVFRYDTLGRAVFARDPDVGTREMKYDDRMFLIRHRNGAGQVMAFFYDGAGRVLARGPRNDWAAPVAAFTAQPDDYVFTYDVAPAGVPAPARTAGQLASVREPRGQAPAEATVAFSYDPFGRVRFWQRTMGTVRAWERHEHSAAGLLLQQQADDGFELTPEYDRASRAVKLGDHWRAGHANEAGGAGLDAAGRVLRETYGNGLRQTFERDAVGLPQRITMSPAASGTPLYAVDVQRTSYGAPSRVTDLVAGGVDHAASYAYDQGGRLTDAAIGVAGPQQWRFSYRYDGLQNMTARRQSGPRAGGIGVLTGYYEYGQRGKGPRQLTTVVHRDCPGTSTTYDYDGAGRLVQDGTRRLTYDGYDQLVRVEEPAGMALVSHAYGYDGLRTYTKGRTSEQYWFSAAHTLRGSERWHYVSVGDRLVARVTHGNTSSQVPTASVLSSAGRAAGAALPWLLVVLTAAGLVQLVRTARRPVWQSCATVITSLAFLLSSVQCGGGVQTHGFGLEARDKRLYFHQGVGNGPTLITGSAGQILEERRFEPFGHPIDADLNRDPFNGLNKETNVDTGWSYHGARWMAPQTARWSVPDPPVKAPDPDHVLEPWDLNPYQYARQSPTLYWDPDGELPWLLIGAAAIYTLLKRTKTANAPAVGEATIPNPPWHEELIGTFEDVRDILPGPKGGFSGRSLAPTPRLPGAGAGPRANALPPAKPPALPRPAPKPPSSVAKPAAAKPAAPAPAVSDAQKLGRSGRQERLRELADDPKVSSADRGWIKNEMRHIERGDRKVIRMPGNSRKSPHNTEPGKVLAHPRGKRAKDGNSYKDAVIQDDDLHKLEHKYEGYK